jgi:hypothetical protein
MVCIRDRARPLHSFFAFGAIAAWVSAKGVARDIDRSPNAGSALLFMILLTVLAWNRTLD